MTKSFKFAVSWWAGSEAKVTVVRAKTYDEAIDKVKAAHEHNGVRGKGYEATCIGK
jgi:hypothetical protein